MNTRKKRDFEKKVSICLYIYLAIMVFFTVFSILYSVGIINFKVTTSHYREELNLDDCLDDILLLKEESFSQLSDKEKIHVLQTLVYVENSKAGIKPCPKIKLRDLPDSIAGCYDQKRCEISIDKEVFHKSSSRTLTGIVLHEFCHHLLNELASAYEALPVRYKDLEAFCLYREYAYEIDHYIDSSEDFAAYYHQSVETECRHYSESQTESYFAFIYNYDPE